ncbi:MAG: 1-(5-phosphoribosyl)-5-[(5-phosphoribosylamino)methylideneamino]imidazole-4-carboxamide isomerase [Anaerolineae bacterium]|nr:1-(5-phosphoribosyl)-5-[(5-phosphoribosylamino)methylideneamino]imidazole-4-carboxamide isomerase [Anaerolineae bacterium]MDQ7035139.1 1-(5-phosphoribosyl)-5-[(5-phosphoribosylamino)methylideneamino]imidazole-4-carboxamide isomerase [Anaerolineae bacterium]
MIVYPAIDMRGGKVVRLMEGDPNRQTVFNEDPVAQAKTWIEQGAEWLHMVNLDGAFDDDNDCINILEQVAKLDVKVQFGGGLRSLEAVKKALKVGVDRVVIGTLAAQDPDSIAVAVKRHGTDAICVAMDARDGLVTTHGWTEKTNLTPIEFGRLMQKQGVVHALFTDVNRDGSMLGVNVHDTIALARNTDLQVIASGGISKMIDIQQLAHSHVIAGVIIGMALYKDEISLNEALVAAKEQP